MPRCWTCRRRRLKCDGGSPHCRKCEDRGVQCLGYEKPLKWVSGVHTRGPMKNRGFGGQTFSAEPALSESPSSPVEPGSTSAAPSPAVSPASSSFSSETCQWSTPSTSASSPTSRNTDDSGFSSSSQVALHLSPPQVPVTLTEPIFQDFNYTSRFLIDYFSYRICPIIVLKDGSLNMYRDLIPLVGSSPAFTSAIMALSTCHLAHSLTGSPIMDLTQGRSAKMPRQAQETHHALGGALRLSDMKASHLLFLSRDDLVQHCINYKQTSLKLLAEALACPETAMEASTLAAVAMMMHGNMFESGVGSWEIHLEGAKGLLEAGVKVIATSTRSGLGTLIDEMSMFEAIGLSLARPGIRKSLAGSQSSLLDWTAIGCPTRLLDIMKFLASQRLSPSSDLDALDEALADVASFDVWTWASTVIEQNESVSHMAIEDLHQLGLIFKSAIEVYGSRIASTVKNDPDLPQPSVEPLIALYSYFDREDDYLYKCLVWPTFIAGAASTNSAQREWAQRTCDRIWRITLSANCRSAAHVLGILWARQDEKLGQTAQKMVMPGEVGASDGDLPPKQPLREDWDWISELLSLEDSWLFA